MRLPLLLKIADENGLSATVENRIKSRVLALFVAVLLKKSYRLYYIIKK